MVSEARSFGNDVPKLDLDKMRWELFLTSVPLG
jgi:hypothetical protein